MYVFNKITVKPQLPKSINRLDEIANNLWWSWNSEYLRLLKKIDRDLWETVEKNPVKFLKRVSQERLEMAAKDSSFVKEYEKVLKMNLAGGMDVTEALKTTEATCRESVPVSFLESGENTQSHSSLYSFFVYIPYVFFSIGVMAFGTILIQFEKKELQNRMNCSGYSRRKIQTELLLGMLTAGVGLCALYFLIAYAGLGNKIWSFKGLLSAVNMLCFMLVTFGFVYMISKMVAKTQLLSMISNLVVLGMCFLAGVFVPLEYLSDTLVKAAHFLPVYWYVEAVRRIDAMAEDSMSAVNVLPDFGMQILFAVTLAAAGAAYARRCQKRI